MQKKVLKSAFFLRFKTKNKLVKKFLKNFEKTLDKRRNRVYNHQAFKKRRCVFLVGVDDVEGPPVPIPNTVVKLNSAENTWLEAAREDRSTPTLFYLAAQKGGYFFAQKRVCPTDTPFLFIKPFQ